LLWILDKDISKVWILALSLALKTEKDATNSQKKKVCEKR